jgi:hypothetical protein
MFKSVEDFLSEFADLVIKYDRTNRDKDVLHFNVLKAMNDIDFSWIKDGYEKRLNTELCIIGQVYSNHMTLMMNEEGKMYGGFDEILYFVSDDGREAIEVICSNMKLEEL